MDHRRAKRYALGMLVDLAVVRAGLIEGQYNRGDTWDQLPPADGRRVVSALIELSEELRSRADGRRAARPQPPVHPDQATLFEKAPRGA